MVSGFLISPYDQDRIFSGLAIEIRIWSKTCAGTCGLKRFMISWFIVFSVADLRARVVMLAVAPIVGNMTSTGAAPSPLPQRLTLLGRFRRPGACLELCRSTLRPSERISLTSTLKLSGMPASNVSSPRTIASYTLVRPATSSDFTVSISCSV